MGGDALSNLSRRGKEIAAIERLLTGRWLVHSVIGCLSTSFVIRLFHFLSGRKSVNCVSS